MPKATGPLNRGVIEIEKDLTEKGGEGQEKELLLF